MAERRGIEWRLRVRLAGDARGNRGGRRILVTVSIHLRKSQLAALDRLADAEHTSRAELVREAIDLLLKRLKRA
jgi:hypothetical protein